MFDWNIVLEIGIFAVLGTVAILAAMWLYEKLGAEKFKMLWNWICVFVQAAEKELGPKTGPAKKKDVVDNLEAIGYKVKRKEDKMIEAAVRELT